METKLLERNVQLNTGVCELMDYPRCKPCKHKFRKVRIVDIEHDRLLTIYLCSICGAERFF